MSQEETWIDNAIERTEHAISNWQSGERDNSGGWCPVCHFVTDRYNIGYKAPFEEYGCRTPGGKRCPAHAKCKEFVRIVDDKRRLKPVIKNLKKHLSELKEMKKNESREHSTTTNES